MDPGRGTTPPPNRPVSLYDTERVWASIPTVACCLFQLSCGPNVHDMKHCNNLRKPNMNPSLSS